MTRLLFAAALALVAAGCATHQKFVAKMDRFVGQPEAAIIGAYGAPQAFYQLTDGSRVLQYTRGGTVALPGATTYVPVQSNTAGTMTINRGLSQSTGTYNQQTTTMLPQQAPPIPVNFSCTVRFTIDTKGIVQSWAAEGNHCVSDG